MMERDCELLYQRYICHIGLHTSSTKAFGLLKKAYYLYIDHLMQITEEDLSLKIFIRNLSKTYTYLNYLYDNFESVQSEYNCYENHLEHCGGIILDSTLTRVLLVRGFKSGSWSFPMGKNENDEDRFECAQREIREESGLQINKPGVCKTLDFEDHSVTLFFGWGVACDCDVAPEEFGEIQMMW